MKKLLTIIAVFFVLNCTAFSQTKFPIFGKKKYGASYCGDKKAIRRTKRKKLAVIGTFVLFVVAGGIFVEGK